MSAIRRTFAIAALACASLAWAGPAQASDGGQGNEGHNGYDGHGRGGDRHHVSRVDAEYLRHAHWISREIVHESTEVARRSRCEVDEHGHDGPGVDGIGLGGGRGRHEGDTGRLACRFAEEYANFDLHVQAVAHDLHVDLDRCGGRDEGRGDEGRGDEGRGDEGRGKDEGRGDEGKDDGKKDDGKKDEGKKDDGKKDDGNKDEGNWGNGQYGQDQYGNRGEEGRGEEGRGEDGRDHDCRGDRDGLLGHEDRDFDEKGFFGDEGRDGRDGDRRFVKRVAKLQWLLLRESIRVQRDGYDYGDDDNYGDEGRDGYGDHEDGYKRHEDRQRVRELAQYAIILTHQGLEELRHHGRSLGLGDRDLGAPGQIQTGTGGMAAPHTPAAAAGTLIGLGALFTAAGGAGALRRRRLFVGA